MNVFTIGTQIDDWITNQLAKAMISRFAAAVRFKHANISGSQNFFGSQNSCGRRAAPQGQRVRMLEQKQRVRLRARQNRALGLLLDCQRSRIIDESQTVNLECSLAHQVWSTAFTRNR